MGRSTANSASPLVAGFLTAAMFVAGAGAYEVGRNSTAATAIQAPGQDAGLPLPVALPVQPAMPESPVQPVSDPRPLVVLVIDDAGIDPQLTQAAMDLPVALTFSFLPYAAATPELAAEAAARGNDVFLHMPMEPVGLEDPGPGALTRHLPPDVLASRVERALAQVPGAIGLNNHMGSAFTADTPALQAVFNALSDRDLVFLDSLTTGRSRAARVAREAGLLALQRDIFIDHEPGTEIAALDEMADMARREGEVIAIAHPRPGTIAALSAWLADPVNADVRFVTIRSYIAERPLDQTMVSNEAVSLLGSPE
ncbi:divergent polysaccharide deacetylase family protein [Hyphobacterium sp.]|uniref:divergent polysaccharide deacetylase family protein n=1 Tax=Hyphobacterium sp. TaxID=2004662 RepID=UPI003B51E514